MTPPARRRPCKETGMAARPLGREKYVLRLYVAGASTKSVRAVRRVTRLCEQYLRGRYRLEVIDVYQQPLLASNEQIAATPTLVRLRPLPVKRLVGDMSAMQRILHGPGWRPAR